MEMSLVLLVDRVVLIQTLTCLPAEWVGLCLLFGLRRHSPGAYWVFGGANGGLQEVSLQ